MKTAKENASSPISGTKRYFYNRKEKSLGLLCLNFLSLYNIGYGVRSIKLTEAAEKLGVVRRRIYDVVNVLEAVGIVSKLCKEYSWIGLDGVHNALNQLKEEAMREKSLGISKASNVTVLGGENLDSSKPSDGAVEQALTGKNSVSSEASHEMVVLDESDEISSDSDTEKTGLGISSNSYSLPVPCSSSKKVRRRPKSLLLLTQEFVKLLISSKNELISLDEATMILLGGTHNPSGAPMKVRRLYDIANVLSSINLIEKIPHPESKKPAFRWLGMNATSTSGILLTKKRQFGTDITNSFKRNKVAPLAPEHTDHARESCMNEINKSKPSSKGVVFGPFHPDSLRNKGDGEKKKERIQHSGSFPSSYRNEALVDIFNHYMEAWKSWYVELMGEEPTESS